MKKEKMKRGAKKRHCEEAAAADPSADSAEKKKDVVEGGGESADPNSGRDTEDTVETCSEMSRDPVGGSPFISSWPYRTASFSAVADLETSNVEYCSSNSSSFSPNLHHMEQHDKPNISLTGTSFPLKGRAPALYLPGPPPLHHLPHSVTQYASPLKHPKFCKELESTLQTAPSSMPSTAGWMSSSHSPLYRQTCRPRIVSGKPAALGLPHRPISTSTTEGVPHHAPAASAVAQPQAGDTEDTVETCSEMSRDPAAGLWVDSHWGPWSSYLSSLYQASSELPDCSVARHQGPARNSLKDLIWSDFERRKETKGGPKEEAGLSPASQLAGYYQDELKHSQQRTLMPTSGMDPYKSSYPTDLCLTSHTLPPDYTVYHHPQHYAFEASSQAFNLSLEPGAEQELQGVAEACHRSTPHREQHRARDAVELLSVQADSWVEMEESVGAVNRPVTNTPPAHPPLHMPRSHSAPSLSQSHCAEAAKLTRAASLPDVKLKGSFEEFTPEITPDEQDETYRFQCSCPGLYQCSMTGLRFHMEGEGDVVYRIVPWDRRLLAQHHKKPAGPLFDISCLQQSVCQLHLPHCEIRPTGRCQHLSVAHVKDEGVEFIPPHKITETHVIINITGFSGFGNVKDDDSPPDPVRALVLLFYKPPEDPDFTSFLSVMLLPRNIVIRDVQRTRKKLNGEERYIDASPHCKLHPKQVYTLSTCPEDDLVKVQPTEVEFDEESHSSYFTSFQVILKTIVRDINLSLKDKNSSCCVWEREVCLSPTREKTLTLPASKKLLNVRSSFIDGTSGPVVNSLLDKLFEKQVIADAERESAGEMLNRRDKARFVIDMVWKKGEAASSEMIEIFCELDPFLCKHLGLM